MDYGEFIDTTLTIRSPNPGIDFSLTHSPVVESPLRMELFLNLAWALLATLMFCLRLRSAAPAGTNPRMQFAALAVLLLILFPVISVTDDLRAALNPAETGTCLRRDYGCSAPHSIIPEVASLPLQAFPEHSAGALPVAAPSHLAAPAIDYPALASIQNRPPPVA